MSCGAACARQFLLDAGIVVDEATIRIEAGFHTELGIDGRGIVAVLEKHLPPRRFRTGVVPPHQMDLLARGAPFFLLMRTPIGKHWVIVDKVDGERAYVRDPAGVPDGPPDLGAEAVLLRSELLERWRRALNGAVWHL